MFIYSYDAFPANFRGIDRVSDALYEISWKPLVGIFWPSQIATRCIIEKLAGGNGYTNSN
jgi:hypothetical protein